MMMNLAILPRPINNIYVFYIKRKKKHMHFEMMSMLALNLMSWHESFNYPLRHTKLSPNLEQAIGFGVLPVGIKSNLVSKIS